MLKVGFTMYWNQEWRGVMSEDGSFSLLLFDFFNDVYV